MATFRDILKYYEGYWKISVLSIGASSAFELIDLVVPYAIGQILNVLSGKGPDAIAQHLIGAIASITQQPANQTLSLSVLLGLIFIVTVCKAPVQTWLGPIDRLLSPKARKNPTSLSSNSWWSKTVDGILFFLIRFASQPYFIKLNAINASKNELDKLTILIFRPKVDAHVEKCIVSDSRQIFTNLNLDYGCELATSPV